MIEDRPTSNPQAFYEATVEAVKDRDLLLQERVHEALRKFALEKDMELGKPGHFADSLEEVLASEDAEKVCRGDFIARLPSRTPAADQKLRRLLLPTGIPMQLVNSFVGSYPVSRQSLLMRTETEAKKHDPLSAGLDLLDTLTAAAAEKASGRVASIIAPRSVLDVRIVVDHIEDPLAFWRGKLVGKIGKKHPLTLTTEGLLFTTSFIKEAMPILQDVA